MYKLEGTEEVFSGGALMYGGLNITNLHGDYSSKLLHLVKI